MYEESPVLLIDDIDAELDRHRIEALIEQLEGRSQTFVSTSRQQIANRYRDRATILRVERGRAMRESQLAGVAGSREPSAREILGEEAVEQNAAFEVER